MGTAGSFADRGGESRNESGGSEMRNHRPGRRETGVWVGGVPGGE